MGRADCRTAITTYLTGRAVPGVGAVHPARPKLVDASELDLAGMGGSGAVLIVHLPKDRRLRRALGGRTGGEKTAVHDVALEVLFASVKPDALAAQDDHDQILDAIVAAVEADRTLGCGYQPSGQPAGPIWQAGEGDAGIDVEMAEPVLSGQVLRINAVIRFEAWEWVVT